MFLTKKINFSYNYRSTFIIFALCKVENKQYKVFEKEEHFVINIFTERNLKVLNNEMLHCFLQECIHF